MNVFQNTFVKLFLRLDYAEKYLELALVGFDSYVRKLADRHQLYLLSDTLDNFLKSVSEGAQKFRQTGVLFRVVLFTLGSYYQRFLLFNNVYRSLHVVFLCQG